MQYGTYTQNLHCARCSAELTTSLIYRDGFYWHDKCWQEGSRQLANAERLARSLQPELFVHPSQYPLDNAPY